MGRMGHSPIGGGEAASGSMKGFFPFFSRDGLGDDVCSDVEAERFAPGDRAAGETAAEALLLENRFFIPSAPFPPEAQDRRGFGRR